MQRDAYDGVGWLLINADLSKGNFKGFDRRGVALLRCGENDTIGLRR